MKNTNKIIGSSINRFDAIDKVTGKAKYAQDINISGQLTLRCVFAMQAHAIIRTMDVSKALELDGVITILTAKDVPCNEYGVIFNDQPVLCGIGSSRKYADHVLYQGDQVALIIAENENIAKQAEKLIVIIYDPLPVISDPQKSIIDSSTIIHREKTSNILCKRNIRTGEVDDAFQRCDVIIESQYRTPTQEHAYLQPEAGIAYMHDGQIVVNTAGQWAHHDQEQIAHALQIPKERIRVIYSAIGGAFGGKEDISVQIPLALAVQRLHEMDIHRPVKMVWSRKESFIGHHKRHPFIIDAKWGATKDGHILAAEMRMLIDCGAYASSSEAVINVASVLSTGPYFIPNTNIDVVGVYTNNIPNGAFRGFGTPQVTFAAEMQINKIAASLGIDPVEIRLRNSIKEGQPSIVGTPLPTGISIERVIRQCARDFGWIETNGKWHRKIYQAKANRGSGKKVTGIGFASGYKSFGIPPDQCWAIIELHGTEKIENAVVKHGGADLGQGAYSVFKQFAAQALHVSLDIVSVDASDTHTSRNAGSTSASRITFMAGNAIIGAAEKALNNWKAGQRPAIGNFQYKPIQENNGDDAKADPYQLFGFGYVAEAIRVQVDLETGMIKILDLVCANDVGKAINPQQVEGQMAGSIIQALGYATLENLIQEGGTLRTQGLATYLVPTIMDIPENFKPIIVETPDPLGPYGARGMAEMPFGPVAPAIAAAVHDATGTWIDELPMTPERVINALQFH